MENPFDAFEVVSEVSGMDAYGRATNPRLVDNELPTDEMVKYALDIRAQLQDAFDEAGIRNPSTADNTDRRQDWRRTAVFATPGVTGPKRGLAIARNIVSLKQAKARTDEATARY